MFSSSKNIKYSLEPEHFDTSTSGCRAQSKHSLFRELVPELVEGTDTKIEITDNNSHFDKLNDRVLVVEQFDKLSVSPVEGTDKKIEGTGTNLETTSTENQIK
ncbi:MAG: hypothetical protein LC105_04405 [Chitinophagales bacterium]|nr:hypothetical protein [Chitinophagales bacterium]